MDQSVPRARLFWVAGAYAAVVAVSAALIFERYMAYVRHPDDPPHTAGCGPAEVFITGMLLVVSFFLVIAIFKYEAAYTTYSKILVALSLTAPASVGLMAIPAVGQSNSLLGYACLYRVLASPLVLLGLGMSRLFARFPKPKQMTNYALLIEALTLAFMVLLLFLPFRFRHA